MAAEGNEQVPAFESGEAAAGESRSSSCDAHQLVWDGDADQLDGDDISEAQGDDWRYAIHPVLGHDGETVGYHVSGGDNDSGEDIGSSLLEGRRDELTLPKAKAAAEANYASRYREAE